MQRIPNKRKDFIDLGQNEQQGCGLFERHLVIDYLGLTCSNDIKSDNY